MGEERIAIYPGTFDPLTSGHESLIRRGLEIFDTVIVGVARDCGKNPLFSLEERVAIVEEVFKGTPGVKIMPFSGLLVEFAAQNRAKAILRGLRAVSDFDYEFQMALMNRSLRDDCETIFMMPTANNSFVSSRLVKEVANLGADYTKYVPEAVARRIAAKLKEKNQ